MNQSTIYLRLCLLWSYRCHQPPSESSWYILAAEKHGTRMKIKHIKSYTTHVPVFVTYTGSLEIKSTALCPDIVAVCTKARTERLINPIKEDWEHGKERLTLRRAVGATTSGGDHTRRRSRIKQATRWWMMVPGWWPSNLWLTHGCQRRCDKQEVIPVQLFCFQQGFTLRMNTCGKSGYFEESFWPFLFKCLQWAFTWYLVKKEWPVRVCQQSGNNNDTIKYNFSNSKTPKYQEILLLSIWFYTYIQNNICKHPGHKHVKSSILIDHTSKALLSHSV